ncbi:SpoIIE family protein phosphatase [Streptomyces sp. NPDC090052]|nr:SpoIIE family protein phosphatase [Streptomyces sp. NBC_01306]MCX4727926.1 SpoIIE family protein phosphatase [Streptomyces sp. NBC_01306]WSX40909.1 SpoIIE family protein phosphatase [Streptomyces sp. NBC_00963]
MNIDDAVPEQGQAGGHPSQWAVITVDEQGVVTGWSPGARHLLGYADTEAVGGPMARFLDPATAPRFWTFPADRNDWAGEITAQRQDGGRLTLTASGHRFAGHGARRQWVLLLALPGPPHPAEEERPLLDWVFAGSPFALTVYGRDLRCRQQNAAMSRLTGEPEGDRRGKRPSESFSGPDVQDWENRLRRAIETGEPVPDTELHAHVPAHPGQDRIYTASAFPLHDRHGAVLGICATATDITEQHRARQTRALLNQASTRIGSTLDVMRTAQELADVAVPGIADWANVDLLETLLQGEEPTPFTAGVELRRAANRSVHEGSPEALHQVGDVGFYPADSPPVRCMATGESVIHRMTDRAAVSWLAQDPVRADSFRRHRFQSVMVVPVRARGTVLGITVLLRRSGEPFTDDDRRLAEELVARAAVCLDNARRFQRERTAALTLQRSLLPHRLPPQTAVDTAWRYLPAGSQSGVGGDWFDVIPLSGARVALVVGDVVGHGIAAAATMGRLRTAVRTLADVDLPPDELLTHLDDVVTRLATEGRTPDAAAGLAATCVYAVYDPVSHTCCIARAGHPPPAVIAPDGTVEYLELPLGAALGLGSQPFESAEVDLAEGSLLALFSDGLINSHENGTDDGLRLLGRVLAQRTPSLDELCDSVLKDLLPARPADDVALLIARTRALAADRVAVLPVPADPAFVTSARSWATRQLNEWGLDDEAFVIELVVSELVTNAIRYGRVPIELRLIRDQSLICEVSDSSSTTPHMRRALLSDEGGRGLLLVAQLTQRWGTRHSHEGKTIWCEQPLPADAAAH